MRQSWCEMEDVEPITLLLKVELSVFCVRVKDGTNVRTSLCKSHLSWFYKTEMEYTVF